MEKWTELRTAYQVAKCGTVSAAARAMDVHRATVNRHIDVLERELGAPIFIRNAKGYALTDLGEDLLQVATKTEDLFEDLVGRARGRGRSVEGEIKITALPSMTQALIKPIRAFRLANPNCQVTLIATEDLQRLEYGEAHVALRAGSRPDHPDYIVQSLAEVDLNIYGRADYLAQNGMPARPSELARHSFVLPSPSERHLPVWSWILEHVENPTIAIASNDPVFVRDAVLSGFGLGVLSDFDARDHSDLCRVFPRREAWAVPLWLVTHVDLHRTAKVQELLLHLKAFGKDVARS